MLDARIRNEQIDDLARAMIELDDMDEAYSFFEDIFTIHELQAVAQRLAVARLLRKKVTYQEIAEKTGASTATISRVNRCLTYGAGGYQRMLNKLDKADAAKESER
ncbi:MAG: TrpR-like protein YerC/YecD [Clostridia bacterium]|nr:TrpR-like protein YerC/YecD [Clostridia bacterium]